MAPPSARQFLMHAQCWGRRGEGIYALCWALKRGSLPCKKGTPDKGSSQLPNPEFSYPQPPGGFVSRQSAPCLVSPRHCPPQGGWEGHYLRVLSFFSRALACCSLMMVALTWGGFMCTFSFPPTRSRTVAANLVCVFSTWGGCFSMMKVLGEDTGVTATVPGQGSPMAGGGLYLAPTVGSAAPNPLS